MRYKIWDGIEPIITPAPDPNTGKQIYTPEEFKVYNPIAAIPGVKFIISNSTINGAVIMEVSQTAQVYKQMGADIRDNDTPEQIAQIIEDFEDYETKVSIETAKLAAEREQALFEAQIAACEAQELQAAMIEYQTMMML